MTAKTITIPIDDYEKLKNTVNIPRYEYERLYETINVLIDKETMEEIKVCKKQIKEGKFKTLKQLKSEL